VQRPHGIHGKHKCPARGGQVRPLTLTRVASHDLGRTAIALPPGVLPEDIIRAVTETQVVIKQ
jgi:hypothetical protein